MTLSTKLWIHQPVDVRELHAFLNEELKKADNRPAREIAFKDDLADPPQDRWSRPQLANSPGQGLPAWLIVSHSGDYGATEVPEQTHAADHDPRWCPVAAEAAGGYDLEQIEECEDSLRCGYYAEVDWDTGYGYRDAYGGCAVLHARFIVALASWLDARGITDWTWQNEYTGAICTRLDGLEDFLSDGDRATEWFKTVVRPVIRASGGREV